MTVAQPAVETQSTIVAMTMVRIIVEIDVLVFWRLP
jgi:hypothetical protein